MLHAQKINCKKYGFSLIELLIVLALLGIFLCIVYPNYTQHLVAVRRTNVAAVLLDLAARMEQFYISNNSYLGAKLAQLGTDDSSYQKYYQLSIKSTADTYLLSAMPLAVQAAADQVCGTLSLDEQGNKTISGSGVLEDCWP